MTIQLPGMKMMERQIQHLLLHIATSADGAEDVSMSQI